MNVLILGSQGFIGSHLVTYCLGQGFQVTGCDLVENPGVGYAYHKVSILSTDFDTLFAEQEFDFCINGSGSGNVSYSMSHPMSDFEANALAVAKVLDTIRKYRPQCRYVHLSSAAVYGNPSALPIVEDMKPGPLSPYGWHKVMAEQLCLEYHQLFNLQVAMIRPFSVYGDGLRKQLLWDLCMKLQQQDNVTLFGTGDESRDFIHVEDLCRLIGSVIRGGAFKAEIYNAATGIQVYIRDLAASLKKCYDPSKTISFNGEQRKGDPLNWQADISRAKALGFVPEVDLEEGIRRYVEFFKEVSA